MTAVAAAVVAEATAVTALKFIGIVAAAVEIEIAAVALVTAEIATMSQKL